MDIISGNLCRDNCESAAVSAALVVKAALASATMYEEQIKVQPTSIVKRRQNIDRD